MGYDLGCGDALELLQTLPSSSVDLIATDPPYFKVKKEAWDRAWDKPEAFLAWLDTILAEFQRVLKPNGSLYLFGSPKMAARVEVLIGERFNVLNRITWAKPMFSTKAEMTTKEILRTFFPTTEAVIFAEHPGNAYASKGDEIRGVTFEPLRTYLDGERIKAGLTPRAVNGLLGNQMAGHYFTRVQWTLPTLSNYKKLQATGYFQRPYEHLRADYEHLRADYEHLRADYEHLRADYEHLRRPFSVTADVPYTDVWTFKTVNTYPGKHVCEKPLELMQHIVRTSSRPGAVVLDAFMGSGTTGAAALSLGRDFIGFDLDPHWFERARERCAAAVLGNVSYKAPPKAKQHPVLAPLFAEGLAHD